MTNLDFSIGLTEENVKELTTHLSDYAKQIARLLKGLHEQIANELTKANYEKLQTALNGIIDLYEQNVQTDLKQRVLLRWEQQRQLLQQLHVGEESVQAAEKIHATFIDEIFKSETLATLRSTSIQPQTGANIASFENIKQAMHQTVQYIQELSADFLALLKYKTERNSLYKFVLPPMTIYSEGVCAYFQQAELQIGTLQNNYVQKMAKLKEMAVEVKNTVNLSNLLELTNSHFAGLTAAKNSTQHMAPSKHPIVRRYDRLTQAVQVFNRSQCQFKEEEDGYIAYLDAYDAKLLAQYDKRLAELQAQYDYYNTYYLDLRKKKEEALYEQYLSGMFSYKEGGRRYGAMSKELYDEFHAKEIILVNERRALQRSKDNLYNAEKNRYAEKILPKIGSCHKLMKGKQKLIEDLRKPQLVKETSQALQAYVNGARKSCKQICQPLQLIEQELHILVGKSPHIEKPIAKTNETSVELVDHDAALQTFKRLKKPLTFEENLQLVNPKNKISKTVGDGRYTRNCQRCVLTYEARARGYDVIAKSRILDGSDNLPIMTHTEGWANVFEGGKAALKGVKAKNIEDAILEIEEQMASYGHGARAIIRIGRKWEDTDEALSGHVFIAEQRGQKTVFCDPQIGKIDAKRNFSSSTIKQEDESRRAYYIPTETIYMLRVDNLKFTERVVDCFE